ncbi:MAG TPA: Gfo/Idh/MocA family oxidoreductase, partial [Pirellulaceae bacterium]
MKLRVGLIGLGNAWENRHRPALRALSDRFEVRAVCEEVALRARTVASEFQADPVEGFRSLTSRSDIDAILMLSPQWFGPLPILAACDAGKAIYCAAALDLEPGQAEMLKQRVEDSGVAFMAEFPRRQSPATIRLKELMATGLGRPQLIFCHKRLVTKESLNGHPLGRSYGSPITRELIELVDWCRFVAGSDPTSVMGIVHFGPSAPITADYRMMSLDFSPAGAPGTGAVAQISCGHYMPEHWREAIAFRSPAGLKVACEHGVAFVDLPANLIWFDSAGRHQESLDTERPVGEQMLGQFHRAVTSLY